MLILSWDTFEFVSLLNDFLERTFPGESEESLVML
jgi:hypothetical protein